MNYTLVTVLCHTIVTMLYYSYYALFCSALLGKNGNETSLDSFLYYFDFQLCK